MCSNKASVVLKALFLFKQVKKKGRGGFSGEVKIDFFPPVGGR